MVKSEGPGRVLSNTVYHCADHDLSSPYQTLSAVTYKMGKFPFQERIHLLVLGKSSSLRRHKIYIVAVHVASVWCFKKRFL